MSNIKISVIGCGYWGKNLVRNFSELGALHSVCDANHVVSIYSFLKIIQVHSIDLVSLHCFFNESPHFLSFFSLFFCFCCFTILFIDQLSINLNCSVLNLRSITFHFLLFLSVVPVGRVCKIN